jgi:hypothetical protein
MLPFFIWPDYMGWFRSVSLKESVCLDASYHGGNHVVDPDRVRPEDMAALQCVKTLHGRRMHAGQRAIVDITT